MNHLKPLGGELENTKYPDDIKRQAVVIIHGIGEQRPMDTLRRFVEAILHREKKDADKKGEKKDEDEKEGCPYYSKPDTISDSYELRRIKLKKFKDPKTGTCINEYWRYQTDFFEYYWAHHMSGTDWWHVFSWIRRILLRSYSDLKELLCRRLRNVTKNDRENQKRKDYEYQINHERNHHRLGLIYALTWAFIIAAIAVVLVFVIFNLSRPVVAITGAPILVVLLAFLYPVYKFLREMLLNDAKNTIGDAARYLDIAPPNIARRYDIVRGGINMLRSLHEKKSPFTKKGRVRFVYDRIVIVGHSLGSIIAYDLLKHYWYEVNGHLPINDVEALKEESCEPLEEAEWFYCQKDCPDIGQSRQRFWKAQYNLWKYLNREWLGKEEFKSDKAPRARWLITDFITLGSPLSYGTLLLADSVNDFETRTELRELPVCPPDRSRNINPGQFVVPLDQEADVSPTRSYDILHHGALFAVTRWTNFYFPKDLIAGEIKNVFGEGIRDIKLEGPNSWFSSHTSYWDLKSTQCLHGLRAVLKDVRWSENLGDRVGVGKSEALPPIA